MATATQNDTAQQAEEATQRFREINEQALEFGRKAGLSFLDAYETTAKTFADYQDKVADQTPVEWVASAAHTQARFTRELTGAYASAARSVLK